MQNIILIRIMIIAPRNDISSIGHGNSHNNNSNSSNQNSITSSEKRRRIPIKLF